MSLESLRPADTPEHMTPAWLGCIHWALGNEEIVSAFRADTGMRWRPATTPFDRMIDQAVGAERQFLEAFIRWVNVNVWGPVNPGEGSSTPETKA
jgi:hypothetical protein